MSDLLVTNGRVVTQNAERDVVADGALAITDERIEAVGPTAEVTDEYDADRVVDADGGAVIPGLINTHTHVSDVVLRGGAFAADRGLYDWLYNVKRPASVAMTPDEHAVAAALYCLEAIRAGVTTFVENDTEVVWDAPETIEAKLDVYDTAGVRNVYGAGFADSPPDEAFEALLADYQLRDSGVEHPPADHFAIDTDRAVRETERLIERHHGSADGRQSVWPTPIVLASSSTRGLREASRLAEEHDVRTTMHIAEAEVEEADAGLSSIEYLRNAGYLGERTLLGHCVQIDAGDVRLLAKSGTSVAHNFMANMRLATGFAPVVELLDAGVTVGLGTDNANLNDTVNPLSDLRAVASAHKGYHRDPGVIPAQTAFDMVTIDGARAIGRADDLGSLEAGKLADVAIIDLDHPHLTPCPDPVHALVYAAQGFEVDTVLCAGDIVMEEREVATLDDTAAILRDAAAVGADVVERVGIE
ncbi:atrazine chlorohydrolase/5-methylthioadenosine/S-adenosylhomocysteine deaminase [Halarchaeum solikamskense]|uniref:amidohydrolase family protein n=1 Tax=Halarchaeum nitratireducens TaxID=489913 RepID=UPI003159A92B|nr:atrazine chlorohydrolase/5-methylthioadenosine/S-adenosylhomocysteine deaminase [Halarchaeum solikamskense]